MHRNVKFVAAGVFEMQEFRDDATRIERNQAVVAPDTIFRVYDWRTLFEIIELADDCFRIALETPSPAALTYALAEQLLLANNCDICIRQQDAVFYGRYSHANADFAGLERGPVIDPIQVEITAGKHSVNLFPAAGRIARKQDPPAERFEKLHQRSCRVFVLGFDFQRGWQSCR